MYKPFKNLLLTGVALLGMTCAGFGETLTLDQLFAQIESENLQVLLNREGVEQALQDSRASLAKLLPRIDGVGTQKRSRTVSLALDFPTTTSNRMDAVLQGSMPLFDFTKINDYRLAKLGHKISEEAHELFVQEILFGAGGAFFGHLRNLSKLDVLDANIRRDEALLMLAKIQKDAGVATALDVTRAEGRLAADKRARLQQETVVKESELLLKVFLALPMQTELTLDNHVYVSVPGVRQAPLGVSELLERRPDYQKASSEYRQSELDYEKAWWAYAPVLEASGNWGVAAKTVDRKKKEQWSYGVTLTVPIFDGFGRGAERHKTYSRMREREYFRENLENTISSEQALAWQDVSSRFEQIPLARQQVSLAQQELDLSRSRFEQGLTGNQEVIDAQASLSEAEDGLVDVIYQYNLSRLQLAKVRGNVREVLD